MSHFNLCHTLGVLYAVFLISIWRTISESPPFTFLSLTY